MKDDPAEHEGPTRRDYVKYGGGLLAGCTDASESSSTGATSTDTSESGSGETSTGETESWTATMPPIGEVEFDSVPESVVFSEGFVADIAVALGQTDVCDGFAYNKWVTEFYDLLPGISVEEDVRSILDDGSADKEILFEIDPDLIAIDPNAFINYYQMDSRDVEQINSKIAPTFGQGARGPRGDGWATWPDEEPYPYLDMYEQTRVYGDVFREQERAEAIIEANRELVEEVRSRIPPEEERPTAAVFYYYDGTFGTADVDRKRVFPETVGEDGEVKTFSKKQYRDLGMIYPWADRHEKGQYWLENDLEAALEIDPDVLILDNGLNSVRKQSDVEYLKSIYETFANDPVASPLTAVQTDRFYLGGAAVQGPIANMFQLEAAAKQLYPEEFGEWPKVGNVSEYPDGFEWEPKFDEIPEDEQLFDRQRVADIINGDI